MFREDQGVGYDINCVLDITLHNSSLREEVVKNRLQLVVDAFHCWAHKRSCQLKYHPLYQPGFRLEDLSTCERFFSSLNGTARNIWHSSSYHWMQSIDLHIQQVNKDRYTSLGKSYDSYPASCNALLMLLGLQAIFYYKTTSRLLILEKISAKSCLSLRHPQVFLPQTSNTGTKRRLCSSWLQGGKSPMCSQ